MADAFEYLLRPHPTLDSNKESALEDRVHVLNGLGSHGWELVAVTTMGTSPLDNQEIDWLYFKRRLP